MLILNGTEFGEDLFDDALKLLQSFETDLRDVVNHDVGVDPKLFLGLFPVYVIGRDSIVNVSMIKRDETRAS